MFPREQILNRVREEAIDQLREREIKRIVKILINTLSGTEYEVLSASILDLCPVNEEPSREFRLRLALRSASATRGDSEEKEVSFVQNP